MIAAFLCLGLITIFANMLSKSKTVIKNMIAVTKTFLPPLEEYHQQVDRAWKNQWLTNRGELVLELEDKLCGYLGVNNIIITNNGTIPLQIALKLFGNGGEIITTPFSYVATTAAIVWENCTPVFVDIPRRRSKRPLRQKRRPYSRRMCLEIRVR
jgi:dTDP-4-amino-4,6-dideoxygalactose transaminase